ncbi:MAG: PAC2 family protein [Nitrososphaerales archaeon]
MTWIKYIEEPMVKEPIAIVGSPGLRSVGKIAVEYLIEELKPRLVAELYSPYFPIIYQTRPSYVSHPYYPGQAGIRLEGGRVELPRVEFYLLPSPRLLITKGYHANFKGQYEVANQVLNFYQELGVKRLIAIAGYGIEGKEVCCAATDLELIKELEEYDIDTGYEGPFFGFSGLVFGLGMVRGIKGICLFGRTKPVLDDPEYPDPKAAKAVLERLSRMLNFTIDLSKLEERKF